MSVLEDVSLLIREASSVLTDWQLDPGTYTSVESLTALLIQLSMQVLLGVKLRSFVSHLMPSVNAH